MPAAFVSILVLVPTRVGMILHFALYVPSGIACPHTRGDDPGVVQPILKYLNLSPHAWG